MSTVLAGCILQKKILTLGVIIQKFAISLYPGDDYPFCCLTNEVTVRFLPDGHLPLYLIVVVMVFVSVTSLPTLWW